MDVLSLFSTLLTSITSEAAVSPNEPARFISLVPGLSLEKPLHFLKALLTPFSVSHSPQHAAIAAGVGRSIQNLDQGA